MLFYAPGVTFSVIRILWFSGFTINMYLEHGKPLRDPTIVLKFNAAGSPGLPGG